MQLVPGIRKDKNSLDLECQLTSICATLLPPGTVPGTLELLVVQGTVPGTTLVPLPGTSTGSRYQIFWFLYQVRFENESPLQPTTVLRPGT